MVNPTPRAASARQMVGLRAQEPPRRPSWAATSASRSTSEGVRTPLPPGVTTTTSSTMWPAPERSTTRPDTLAVRLPVSSVGALGGKRAGGGGVGIGAGGTVS